VRSTGGGSETEGRGVRITSGAGVRDTYQVRHRSHADRDVSDARKPKRPGHEPGEVSLGVREVCMYV
jgi:hypothetical protein